MQEFLKQASQVSVVMLEVESEHLDAELRNAVMSDLAEGHRFLLFMVSIRFIILEVILDRILGLLHHDEQEARKCAQ